MSVAATGLGATATAQELRRVGLSLMLSHASPHPGPVDAGVADLHRQLQREFGFESLRVLQRRQLDLRLQEVGGFDLPSGKRVQFQPMAVGPTGLLVAIEIPGTLQTDLRVPNHKLVVIGVESYQDGKLILTLQPDFEVDR